MNSLVVLDRFRCHKIVIAECWMQTVERKIKINKPTLPFYPTLNFRNTMSYCQRQPLVWKYCLMKCTVAKRIMSSLNYTRHTKPRFGAQWFAITIIFLDLLQRNSNHVLLDVACRRSDDCWLKKFSCRENCKNSIQNSMFSSEWKMLSSPYHFKIKLLQGKCYFRA